MVQDISLPCEREVARRSRDGRIPFPRPQAFPLPGGRCPRRGRMRVGLVGAVVIAGGHRGPPLPVFRYLVVGADIIRPRYQCADGGRLVAAPT